MRIFLAGVGGLVGRNFLEHPAVGEFEVLSPSSGELNLLDFAATKSYFERHRLDIIIHAAGRVGGIQANVRQPVRFFLDNLDLGRNVVWAAFSAGVKRLLNLGSSCMYPRDAANPLKEEMILQGELEPTNEGYALAKIAAARLCEYITRENPEYLYKTVIPCNLYGRHDRFDPSRSHLVAAAIHKLHEAKISGVNNVEIWGDGRARREFMYAGDLAECLVEAVRRFDSLPDTINVGVGTDLAIDEYYERVAEVVGYRGTFSHNYAQPTGMTRKLLNISRSQEWGWRAKMPLEEGLRKTYSFYLELRQNEIHGISAR